MTKIWSRARVAELGTRISELEAEIKRLRAWVGALLTHVPEPMRKALSGEPKGEP